MNKFFALTACLVLACSLTGCKQSVRPADLPDDMTPAKITLTQEGTPVEGATIALEYDQPVKYTSSGTTDAKGVATIMTYGYAGAQQGTAKLIIDKIVTEGASESEEYGEAGDLGTDYHTVDAKYASKDTTDLTITIGTDNVNESFELGPAVHEIRK